MLVSISGPHCSGKTTILESLKSSPSLQNDWVFRGGPTRLLKEKGLPINNDQSDNYDETQLACLEWDLATIQLSFDRDTISDRGLVDTYIYTLYLFLQGKVSERVYLDILAAWHGNSKYYQTIFIPDHNDIKLVSDNHRNDDVDFQNGIIKLFEHEYSEPGFKDWVKVSGDNTLRVSTIKSTLKTIKKQWI